MRKSILLLMLCISGLSSLKAQPFAIGNWREHLPYLHGRTLAITPSRIFCATDEGLFAYHFDDNSLERFSKLNGLNDFGISTIAYSTDYKLTILGYTTSNIDFVYDDNTILNFSDIKRKNIPGDKTINRIFIKGRFAYLACGFGIVVMDLERKEVKETYFIGTNGTSVIVNEVAMDNDFIYAATENGVYRGSLNGIDLTDFNNWSKILDDTANAGTFNLALVYNNVLFVNYSRSTGDTIMAWNGNWGVPLVPELTLNFRNRSLRTAEGNLLVCSDFYVMVFDNSYIRTRYVDGSVIQEGDIYDATVDKDQILWVADRKKGLVKVVGTQIESIYPNGPNSAQVSMMQAGNGTLWLTHGPRNRSWNNQYEVQGFSTYKDGKWETYDGKSEKTPLFNTYNFYDVVSLALDPSNSDHVFFGASGPGLLNFKDNQPIGFYRDTLGTSSTGACNSYKQAMYSTLKNQFGNNCATKVHGIAYDYNANLWVSNAGVDNVLSVLKTDGSWKTFLFKQRIGTSAKTGDMVIDKSGYIWTTIFENIGGKDGLLVFNYNNTIDNTADDEYDIAILSERVRSLAVDNDGIIWAGTEGGLFLFYPPSVSPQQILIKQDGSYQYLLAAASVTAIAVDGANRKWVGTESGGLYLFSADGLEEIHHFTAENSPLFSNNITYLAIDDKSGEVYIGTDKGLISYQSEAIAGESGCTDLVVYPNPVKREYDGPIAIKGVVSNGSVKITDVAGNLVYETKALGGQAIWDGKNFKGEKAATGVYIVISSDASGGSTCIAKLMLAH